LHCETQRLDPAGKLAIETMNGFLAAASRDRATILSSRFDEAGRAAAGNKRDERHTGKTVLRLAASTWLRCRWSASLAKEN
jgi:hypothetical protein